MDTVALFFYGILLTISIIIVCSFIALIPVKIIEKIYELNANQNEVIGTGIMLIILIGFLYNVIPNSQSCYEFFDNSFQRDICRKNGEYAIAWLFSPIIMVTAFINEIRNLVKEEKEKSMLREKEKLKKLEQDKLESDKIKEQEEWQKQLDREIERERRLAEVRHESTLMAMQAQIKLYGEYKEKGLDIEKQIFDMRKNLIELEGQENKAMLDEVRQALDDLDT